MTTRRTTPQKSMAEHAVSRSLESRLGHWRVSRRRIVRSPGARTDVRAWAQCSACDAKSPSV